MHPCLCLEPGSGCVCSWSGNALTWPALSQHIGAPQSQQSVLLFVTDAKTTLTSVQVARPALGLERWQQVLGVVALCVEESGSGTGRIW